MTAMMAYALAALAALAVMAGLFTALSAKTTIDEYKAGMRLAAAGMLFAFASLAPAAAIAQISYVQWDSRLLSASTVALSGCAVYASMWIGGRIGAHWRERGQ